MIGETGDPVRLLAGDGLVAREGALSLVCALPAAETERVVDRLLAAFADASSAGEDGRALVRRVIEVLASSALPAPSAPLACAVAGPAGDGVAVLVGGAALAELVTGSGTAVRVGGDAAYTWTDRVVAGPVTRIGLSLPGAREPEPRLRLGSGVVRGGGLVQVSTSRAVRAEEPSAGPPVSLSHPDRPPSSGAAARPSPPSPTPPPPPLPTRAERLPAPARRSVPEPPHVLGVNCKNHHFNDMRAHYCAVCGISMMQATLAPFRGPRPPLGVLLVDDGQTVPLTVDLLIGREPRTAKEVTERTAVPLRLTDSEGSISRRHTLVRLDEWQVELVDLGSVNGTAITPPGGTGFERLRPDVPVVLRPGTAVRIGRSRTFRFESNRDG
ncbi:MULTISPECIES: FHA domain-containing protein [Actinomadura]|uniref:FHA domain-containing protein n=1 Tax=Actinomadura yumaensis TaxID=111807 RepID=A0ABW2CFG8_9ACTN|nr:FHA domain-containing protein [Actinomadura sp. J1-007]MWK38284.1 FHA domain-containing protein [Actinomadura sp. J1-007]